MNTFGSRLSLAFLVCFLSTAVVSCDLPGDTQLQAVYREISQRIERFAKDLKSSEGTAAIDVVVAYRKEMGDLVSRRNARLQELGAFIESSPSQLPPGNEALVESLRPVIEELAASLENRPELFQMEGFPAAWGTLKELKL